MSRPALVRRLGAVVPVLVLCAGVPRPALAQLGQASLFVTVTSAETGAPVSGAQVMLHGLRRGGITDAQGTVALAELPVGAFILEVRSLGYATQELSLALAPNHITRAALRLEVQPIALPEVRADARVEALARRGFYARQERGHGTFFTSEDIDEVRPRHLSDLLRLAAGMRFSPIPNSGGRSRVHTRGSARRACPIQYVIDGVKTFEFNLDMMTPHDVLGMEIYRGGATIPAEFNMGTATCGVIVVWTKQRD